MHDRRRRELTCCSLAPARARLRAYNPAYIRCVAAARAAGAAIGSWVKKAFSDENGKRLFQDGEKAILRSAVEASILQEIQLAMLASGAESKVEAAKADLKS